MFFCCELRKLRKLKNALLARYRCEQVLASLPDQLAYKIENCDEAVALKVAQENLEKAKGISADAIRKKKKLKIATIIAAIVSAISSAISAFIVTSTVALITLSFSIIPFIVVFLCGTTFGTLLVYLIARAVLKIGRAKSRAEIAACEDALALALADYEVAKAAIEAEYQARIAFYENLLNNPVTGINAAIKNFTVVHDDDKNYNTVCQIIWCFEHKYAYSVKEAKQWIARSKHSKYVRQRLNGMSVAPQDEQDIETDANEGQDFSANLPQATPAKG